MEQRIPVIDTEKVTQSVEEALDLKREHWHTISPEEIMEAVIKAIEMEKVFTMMNDSVRVIHSLTHCMEVSTRTIMTISGQLAKIDEDAAMRVMASPPVMKMLAEFTLSAERVYIAKGSRHSPIAATIRELGRIPDFLPNPLPEDVAQHIADFEHGPRGDKLRAIMERAQRFSRIHGPDDKDGRVICGDGSFVIQIYSGREFDDSKVPPEFEGIVVEVVRDIDPKASPIEAMTPRPH